MVVAISMTLLNKSEPVLTAQSSGIAGRKLTSSRLELDSVARLPAVMSVGSRGAAIGSGEQSGTYQDAHEVSDFSTDRAGGAGQQLS